MGLNTRRLFNTYNASVVCVWCNLTYNVSSTLLPTCYYTVSAGLCLSLSWTQLKSMQQVFCSMSSQSYSSASRPMLPASAFLHHSPEADQSSTGTGTGMLPASTFKFNPIPDWPDAMTVQHLKTFYKGKKGYIPHISAHLCWWQCRRIHPARPHTANGGKENTPTYTPLTIDREKTPMYTLLTTYGQEKHPQAHTVDYGKGYALHIYTVDRGGRKVRLIDFPIPIRSSDYIGRYNRLMSSSDFCIGRLCRFVLSSDSFIDRSCFLVLSSDFCIWRLCRPVLSKKSFYRYFIITAHQWC